MRSIPTMEMNTRCGEPARFAAATRCSAGSTQCTMVPMPPPSAAQNADILAVGRQAIDDDATHGPGAAGYQYSIRHGLNLGGPRAPRYRMRYLRNAWHPA